MTGLGGLKMIFKCDPAVQDSKVHVPVHGAQLDDRPHSIGKDAKYQCWVWGFLKRQMQHARLPSHHVADAGLAKKPDWCLVDGWAYWVKHADR